MNKDSSFDRQTTSQISGGDTSLDLLRMEKSGRMAPAACDDVANANRRAAGISST